jgi:VanZ family protein
MTIVFRILFLLSVLAVLVFSIIPDPLPDLAIRNSDKIKHVGAYGTLGFLAVLSFVESGKRLKDFLLSIFFCLVFGGTLEIVQGFVHRQPDLFDEACNVLGGLIGSSAGILVFNRFKPKGNPTSRTSPTDQS